ncbi:MAG: cytochrome P460 family protein [Anaerolineae bacterium]|nr:cytochrome P460 family protein [Anaerolineae bacterium]
MKRKLLMPLIYVLGLAAILAFAAINQAPSEPVQLTPTRTSPMSLPPDFRETYVQYLVVERVDAVVRYAYIQPEALENLQRGEPLPIGTQIIIEAYHAQRNIAGQVRRDDDNRFIPDEIFPTIHAAEKRSEWSREDIASSTRLNGWNFETFDSQTLEPAFENRNDCFVCHDTSAFRHDFIFTRNIIDDFISNNEDVQYFYCNRPDRSPCRL